MVVSMPNGEEAFVYTKQPFRLDRFKDAVYDARVQVSGLILHVRHYGVFLKGILCQLFSRPMARE